MRVYPHPSLVNHQHSPSNGRNDDRSRVRPPPRRRDEDLAGLRLRRRTSHTWSRSLPPYPSMTTAFIPVLLPPTGTRATSLHPAAVASTRTGNGSRRSTRSSQLLRSPDRGRSPRPGLRTPPPPGRPGRSRPRPRRARGANDVAIGDDFNGPGRSEPAPTRHHEPFQKTFFFLEGFVVPQRPPGERQEERLSTRPRGGTGRPPGGCKRALERTFFSRAACSPLGRSRAQSRSRMALLPDPLRRG